MRILFAGGGTAGHINPAIAIADYIKRRTDCEIAFFGGAGNIEEQLVPKAGYPIHVTALSGLSRSLSVKGIRQNIKAARHTVRAKSVAKKLLRDFSPDIVFGTGGYVSYPLVSQAVKAGVKTAILEVNASPGVVTKRLAPKVDCVMVTYPETIERLSGVRRCAVTGSPVRREISDAKNTLYPPIFPNELPTIVSFWGSVGAYYMNKNIEQFIALVAKEKAFNHIHACGKSAYEWLPNELKALGVDLTQSENIDVREYIFDMDRVLALSSLIICRAGASTLAEVCASGTPAIIVPSPHVTDNHQQKNAEALEKKGAAIIIPEAQATGEALYDAAKKLLSSKEKLMQMGQSALKMHKPDALERIYAELKGMV